MIVVHIIGGLGNQMFQYAAGRTLSIARNVPLRLDISSFDNYSLHQGFELHRIFRCEISIVSPDEMQSVLGWRASPVIRNMLSRPTLSLLRGNALNIEPHFHFWPGIHNTPNKSYLRGYWQSEKYFSIAEETIRADFQFRSPLSPPNAAIAKEIDTCGTAVSLHIRRGDYVSNAHTKATHGLCSLDYYQAAIEYITARVQTPVFFVFSDDIAWAHENLRLNSPCHFIDHNKGANSFNDMRLMSMCNHHIIANSSFSWWGAWLNQRPDKIVVAPKKWFTKDFNVTDLLPTDWVRL